MSEPVGGRWIPLLLAMLLLPVGVSPSHADSLSSAAPNRFDHAAWDGLLQRFVHDGEVDYIGFLAHRDLLDGYLDRMAVANPVGWSREEQMAFWINAYNALMIQLVLDHWPVNSVLDVGKVLGLIPTGSIFRTKRPLAGLDRSLDDVEHRVLRGRFKDPRIHAAVNCASASCPPLRGEAYRADRLDAQLDDAMDRFIHDPLRNRVLHDPPQLSAIFKWYGADFEAEGGTVWDYVRSRLTADERARTPTRARPGFLSYDWELNRAPR